MQKREDIKQESLILAFESRMASISQNLFCAHWESGIETIVFHYSLAPDVLNETLNYWALPSSCDKEQVILLIEELKLLWERTKQWFNGEAIINEKEWKSIYNEVAAKSGWVILV
ncbi:hypothetical protein FHW36_11818 [Chitinophaga polysaccharea]|uniref:Uncharacterized protein n=1 Tax=Chitinophaga polysaccharea TaxID=1293035 RepID=A0A561P0Y7_9BACT|nr:hypothetical protein [Chitinophaga polysaccharea]TWF31724.1 hypothetical protein FHW36_11818 [Chitinophaga polysaccharea]